MPESGNAGQLRETRIIPAKKLFSRYLGPDGTYTPPVFDVDTPPPRDDESRKRDPNDLLIDPHNMRFRIA